jgi:ribonuclease Z
MDLEVTFLGTGASAPSARRSTAAVLIARGGERLLFDCGEGTQRQMQKSIGLTQVDEIYLTHFHADHMMGLPGLLKTYELTDRETPLRVFGPPGLKELFTVLRPLIGRLRYPLELGEMKAGERVDHDEYTVEAFEAAHNVRAFGWALVEDDRPGRFDPEVAKGLGVREGPDFARLQRGEEVEGSKGTVKPDQVMGETREGRIVVITGDTAPSSQTVAAAADADLLIHDASFAEEDAQRAAETGHSTLGQAAAVAAEAHVRLLALVHISARYHVGKVLDEAREVFPKCVAPRDFDQIAVPFPERGAPELIQDGARKKREASVE